YVKFALGAAIVGLSAFSGRHARDTNKMMISQQADITVKGTSNIHDWTMEAKQISCSVKFNFLPGNNNLPHSLTELKLSVPVQDLKSGKSSMDSRAYSALRSKQYNNIVFTLTSATIAPGPKNKFQVETTGNLSIAGVTKVVTLKVSCGLDTDGTITCIGSEKLKMSDYQIKPPVYMLGALKTGDELTIGYTVTVKK
ncbi:MAG: YceI family protein, partial [Chitinophagales bacterium]